MRCMVKFPQCDVRGVRGTKLTTARLPVNEPFIDCHVLFTDVLKETSFNLYSMTAHGHDRSLRTCEHCWYSNFLLYAGHGTGD